MESDISKTLEEIGCCKFCCLRFSGITQGTRYEETDEVIQESEKKMKANPCTSCLDFMKSPTCQHIILKIKEEVTAGGYESKTFNCMLKLPLCLVVREKGILLYLKAKHPKWNNECEKKMPTLKTIWKWKCAPQLAKLLNATLDRENSGLQINLNFSHESEEKELLIIEKLKPELVAARREKKRKYHRVIFSSAALQEVLDTSSEDLLKKCLRVPPDIPTEPLSLTAITISSASLFIAGKTSETVHPTGRYLKLSRHLPQTPWMIDGQLKVESSVQQLISDPLLKILPASGGISLSQIQFWLHYREDTSPLKEGEEEKVKEYVALCGTEIPIGDGDMKRLSSIKDLVLQQKTPIRVLHRRPLAVRERTVFWMSGELVSSKLFKLHLGTQAGTYIKEFVHGDFGRTVPNLSSLLNVPVDILALDVTAVHLNWPKPLEDDGTS
ncbi:unnamed protein product [Darwinula stevensoni]|uniref:tRNA pseudouridine(55) synthase n=1 Tax=Darwinula stevensoni TaxID=69355 RepID=A0A7R8XDN9_9CRUS|nr:unnamed protein product [Darwinula stevensoni]CAG0887018.1 unnamed protein product [Darwinula stevensoni]